MFIAREARQRGEKPKPTITTDPWLEDWEGWGASQPAPRCRKPGHCGAKEEPPIMYNNSGHTAETNSIWNHLEDLNG